MWPKRLCRFDINRDGIIDSKEELAKGLAGLGIFAYDSSSASLWSVADELFARLRGQSFHDSASQDENKTLRNGGISLQMFKVSMGFQVHTVSSFNPARQDCPISVQRTRE